MMVLERTSIFKRSILGDHAGGGTDGDPEAVWFAGTITVR